MNQSAMLAELNKDAHDNSVALVDRARRTVTLSRTLHIVSGILALVSGSAITAIATKVLSADSWQAVSAGVAFLSGIVTLLTTTFFQDREIRQMYELAGKFLAIREEGSAALQRPGSTNDDIYKAFVSLSERYSKAASDAAPFLPMKLVRQLPPRA